MHISLETIDLDDEPTFDGLSYTWGPPCTVFRTIEEWDRDKGHRKAPPNNRARIFCDGKPLLVGRNLYDWLLVWQHMTEISRNRDDERVSRAQQGGMHVSETLWIDALCINQDDLREKSAQVAMMGKIYACTQRVIVWLGPEDSFVRPALHLLIPLTEIPLAKAPLMRNLLDGVTVQEFGMPLIYSAAWRPVFAFLNRAWFHRAWIVQELALAKVCKLQCGLLSFNWGTIAQTCRFMYEGLMDEGFSQNAIFEIEGPRYLGPLFYDDLMPILRTEPREDSDRHLFVSELNGKRNPVSYFSGLDAIRASVTAHLRSDFARLPTDTRYIERGDGVPLFELIDLDSETECTDPKDKVYAFLEVGKMPYYMPTNPSSARRDIVPAYDGLSNEGVYLQAAWFLLLSGTNLDLLSRVDYADPDDKVSRSSKSLPSWVPDWNSPRSQARMSSLHGFMHQNWYAAGSSIWKLPEEDKLHQKVVSVEGTMMGNVVEVVEVSDEFSLSRSGVVAADMPEFYP